MQWQTGSLVRAGFKPFTGQTPEKTVWSEREPVKNESLDGMLVKDRGYSFSSFAILDAMFLKPIEVPEIRLKRTPLRDNLGSLQTSISHWTSESVLGSP